MHATSDEALTSFLQNGKGELASEFEGVQQDRQKFADKKAGFIVRYVNKIGVCGESD
jgi:hypothetical protein